MKVLSLLPTAHRRQRRQGQALIGLLAVVLIGFGIYFLYLGPRQGKDGEKRPGVARQSLDAAHGVEADSNIQQIQTAVEMYKMNNDGKPPASLEALKSSGEGRGIPAEMWVDPISKQPLQYDPSTGKVSPPGATPPGTSPPVVAPAAPGQPEITLPDTQPAEPESP